MIRDRSREQVLARTAFHPVIDSVRRVLHQAQKFLFIRGTLAANPGIEWSRGDQQRGYSRRARYVPTLFFNRMAVLKVRSIKKELGARIS